MNDKELAYFTYVQFNQIKIGGIELIFKSSRNPLRAPIPVPDLPTLKKIKSQIGEIIQEIEEDAARNNHQNQPISVEKALEAYVDQSYLADLTDELHQRLHVQARNLLFEYRLSPSKSVPVDKVEDLMRLYGNLIAKLIWEKQKGGK